jgi:GGDEF domain-containing protein
MMNLERRTLRRHVVLFGAITALVVAASVTSAMVGSPGLAAALSLIFGSLAVGGAAFAMYRATMQDLSTERSISRVRPYGERLSIYDKESGLYADWYFGFRLREEIARSERYGQPLTLLLVEDVDQGLEETVKQLVFRSLDETLRNTDIVAHLNARRFAVLLTNTPQEGALVATRRIRAGLAPRPIHVGFACYPEDGLDAPSLLMSAGATTDVISAVISGAESVKVKAPVEMPVADAVVREQDDLAGTNVVELRPLGRTCRMPGCKQPHHARGLCSRHYEGGRTAA